MHLEVELVEQWQQTRCARPAQDADDTSVCLLVVLLTSALARLVRLETTQWRDL